MNKMVDPRDCINFRKKDTCSNQNQELLAYLDKQVISDMGLTFDPETFDNAFEYCANCAHFVPCVEVQSMRQRTH